ncbi:MAG TPA: head-tail connector protein [Allosphingosinicella sp.]|jgi:uncharacterized phiE125 gp8 family phage protein|nr:head-tail connector protein [Allosphingosinicella sp.]
MGEIEVEPAPRLPVSLAEVKAYLRIETSDEDALLAGLIRSAADICEAFLGRLLIARRVDEVLAAPRAWTRLAAAPVRAIETVAALSVDGSAVALTTGAYAVDIDAAAEGWVRLLAPLEAKRVRVTYVAGLATDANGVGEAVRQGLIRLAAHLYVARDDIAASAPPAAVTALWRPSRRLRLH